MYHTYLPLLLSTGLYSAQTSFGSLLVENFMQYPKLFLPLRDENDLQLKQQSGSSLGAFLFLI